MPEPFSGEHNDLAPSQRLVRAQRVVLPTPEGSRVVMSRGPSPGPPVRPLTVTVLALLHIAFGVVLLVAAGVGLSSRAASGQALLPAGQLLGLLIIVAVIGFVTVAGVRMWRLDARGFLYAVQVHSILLGFTLIDLAILGVRGELFAPRPGIGLPAIATLGPQALVTGGVLACLMRPRVEAAFGLVDRALFAAIRSLKFPIGLMIGGYALLRIL